MGHQIHLVVLVDCLSERVRMVLVFTKAYGTIHKSAVVGRSEVIS